MLSSLRFGVLLVQSPQFSTILFKSCENAIQWRDVSTKKPENKHTIEAKPVAMTQAPRKVVTRVVKTKPKIIDDDLKPTQQASHVAYIKAVLQKQLGIVQAEDWYNMTVDQVKEKQPTIFNAFNNLYEIAQLGFPNFKFYPFLFEDFNPKSYFAEVVNQQYYLNLLKEKYNLTDKSMHKITKEVLEQNGGEILFFMYRNSIFNLIYKFYPNENYLKQIKDWKFKDPIVQHAYVNYLEKRLKVENDDWESKLSKSKIEEINKLLFTKQVKSEAPSYLDVIKLIRKLRNPSKGLDALTVRDLVHKQLVDIFERELLIEDEKEIFQDNSNLSVNFYIPSKKLAIDILPENSEIDDLKSSICKAKGITLSTYIITDPTPEKATKQIMRSIKVQIKKLLAAKETKTKAKAEKEKPASVDIVPEKSKKSKKHAVRFTNNDLMELSKWNFGGDPRGWLIFELSLGCIPAFWDGVKLRWRNGNEIKNIPIHKIPEFPYGEPLEGYLWFRNQESSALLAGAEYAWAKARFFVMDAPKTPGNYADRYERIKELKNDKYRKTHDFFAIPEVRTFDQKSLTTHCQNNIKNGTRIIMYDPQGDYKAGLSPSAKVYYKGDEAFMKVKEFSDPFLICEQSNGILSKVAVPSSYRSYPLWVNTIISISYDGRNLAGKYLSPKFVSIRPDIVWQDIVKSDEEDKLN